MASRPVFVALAQSSQFVREVSVDFSWSPGFAPVQKKKNITSLHQAAYHKGLSPLLEVSTKSDKNIGRHLSAFNLKIQTEIGEISVESAYQSSKVFKDGGPFRDIFRLDSMAAKQDKRIKNSGPLVGFDYFGQKWPLIPKTAFYDWLYLSALKPHQEYLKCLFDYNGFTDIEFNPEKSVNCQARTCALFVSLLKLGFLETALCSQSDFTTMMMSDFLSQFHSSDLKQQVDQLTC